MRQESELGRPGLQLAGVAHDVSGPLPPCPPVHAFQFCSAAAPSHATHAQRDDEARTHFTFTLDTSAGTHPSSSHPNHPTISRHNQQAFPSYEYLGRGVPPAVRQAMPDLAMPHSQHASSASRHHKHSRVVYHTMTVARVTVTIREGQGAHTGIAAAPASSC
eukprot:1158350-Pelagomonas_calceolata.AAC.2